MRPLRPFSETRCPYPVERYKKNYVTSLSSSLEARQEPGRAISAPDCDESAPRHSLQKGCPIHRCDDTGPYRFRYHAAATVWHRCTRVWHRSHTV